MTFEFEKLLLLQSPQNSVVSNIVINGKKKKSQRYDMCQGHFKIKIMILQMNHQLNVMFFLAGKNTSIDDDNDDRK